MVNVNRSNFLTLVLDDVEAARKVLLAAGGAAIEAELDLGFHNRGSVLDNREPLDDAKKEEAK